METNSNPNYSLEGSNSQNKKEKHLDAARLNVDSERRVEIQKDDANQNRYYDNKSDDDSAKISGKESSYRSPEDERAYDPENPEKYITQENPDSKEESDSNGVKSPG